MEIMFTKFYVVFVILIAVREIHSCFSFNKSRSITLETGSSFYLECHCLDAEGSVDNLKWLDPDGGEIQPLGPGTEWSIYTEKQPRSLSIHIPNVNKTLAGTYRCVAQRNQRVFTQSILIDAYDPVFFLNTADSQYLAKGTNAVIRCEPRTEYPPIINWYKESDDFIQIKTNDKYQITDFGLRIMNVSDDDAGKYKCFVSVLETGEEVDKNIDVEVLTIPTIVDIVATPNQTILIGDSVTIECIAEGVPSPEYTWKKLTDNGWQDEGSWIQILNTIEFNATEENDTGVYQCTAANKVGENKEDVFIEVLMPPQIHKLENVTASEGSISQIICKASGRPVPELSVNHVDDKLGEEKGIIREYRKTSNTTSMYIMTFQSVQRHYDGEYACTASNIVDTINATSVLTVYHKPYFKEAREAQWAWLGKHVNLSCLADTNPGAIYTWRYIGNDETDVQKQISVNKYILQHFNKESNVFLSFTVNDKSLFGTYECTAMNEFGEAHKTILLNEASEPDVIELVLIKEVSSKSILFDIKGPFRVSGPNILKYIVKYDKADDINITSAQKNKTWSITEPFLVDKLEPNTKYLFRFAAVNEVGIGPWSGDWEVSTTEVSVPKAPVWDEIIEELIKSEEYVRALKWRIDDDDDIDFFVINYCPVYDGKTDNESCRNLVTTDTKLDLYKFGYNITYYMEIIAHNDKGYSVPAKIYVTTPGKDYSVSVVTTGFIISIGVIIIVIGILSLDLMLCVWKKQGLIATCYFRRHNKIEEDEDVGSRDRKGLLREANALNGEGSSKPDGYKEFEYNKCTGVITGKHSSV